MIFDIAVMTTKYTDSHQQFFADIENLEFHGLLCNSEDGKMVEKVIMNFHSTKEPGPDCIPMVILKKYECELSYILAELFSKCMKESCFSDF